MLRGKPFRFFAPFFAGGAILLTALTLNPDAFPLLQRWSERPAQAPAEEVVVLDEFGTAVDAFEAEDREIARNETFAEILQEYDVPYATVVALAEKAEDVFDVRLMQAGKRFRVYQDDSLGAQKLVYEKDPIRYVVFELSDSLAVYEAARPVDTVRRVAGGTITGSLYETLVEQGVSPELAVELAEVYAWQIDFYRIQHGDHFRVVFEEERVDGEPVGLGRILAARFNHFERDYYAFRFEQEGRVAYYDDQGESLRRAFLQAPLKFKRISSRYTKRRFHPVQKRYKAHLGTDYAADPGTPIHAVADGVVLEARFARYNGNYVKIKHNKTYTTGYLHMSRIAKGMRPGTTVRQGDVIGYVGSTGLATGPHLCYRFWKNGQQVDPYKEDIPSAGPIEDENRPVFEVSRDELMPLLKNYRPVIAAL